MMVKNVSFEAFATTLRRRNAKLAAREVHALYLGALTSTSFRLGPQHLLDRILGDEPVAGETVEEANEALQTLFGYWNVLVAERQAGRVRLAPDAVKSTAHA
jgi:hypothetical protein